MIGADVKATAARYEKYKGGSYRCGEQICGSEGKRMTAAPKCVAQRKWLLGDGEAPTRSIGGEGQCPEGRNGREHLRSSRGRGPDTRRKNGRDNVGKDLYAAGAGSNLQRLFARGTTKGEKRVKVWRMSSYERRRSGNALREDARRLPDGGNTGIGQRDSGHLAVPGWPSDSEPRSAVSSKQGRVCEQISVDGVYVCQHLSLVAIGKAYKGKPRSEPDWGKPAVRDRRGACRNVGAMEDGLCGSLWETGDISPVSCGAQRATFLSRPGLPSRLALLLLLTGDGPAASSPLTSRLGKPTLGHVQLPDLG